MIKLKKFLYEVIVFLFCTISISALTISMSFADGWVNDEYGNWLYEENGEFLKGTMKTIDGVNYYFSSRGFWLPREEIKKVWLSGRENVTFTMEGKDDKDRKYSTQLTLAMPVVSGENADAINEFIRSEFQNAITKYYREYLVNALFLIPKIKVDEMMEIYNVRDVIAFGYIGGQRFNLYLDHKNFEMWVRKD